MMPDHHASVNMDETVSLLSSKSGCMSVGSTFDTELKLYQIMLEGGQKVWGTISE